MSMNISMFDIQADPGETKNLTGNTSAAATLAEHRRLLKDYCRRTKDSFGGFA